jgi:transcriptional regulator with XRE-family HTH domain
MKFQLKTVEDAGVVIRALRKQSGIRIDDFALTAKVSKQFMSDLEGGRPTVQMGRVLAMLQAMGVRLSLEVPDAAGSAVVAEQERRRLKAAESTQRPRLEKTPRASLLEASPSLQAAAVKRGRDGA